MQAGRPLRKQGENKGNQGRLTKTDNVTDNGLSSPYQLSTLERTQMARINLNLRDPRSRDASPINVVVRWKGQRLVYPSGERIAPRHWSTSTQRAKGSLTTAPEFNRNLTGIVAKVEGAYLRFLNDNDQRQPSIGELRDQLDLALGRKANEGPRTLFAYIREYIAKARDRVNPDTGSRLARTTLKKYTTTLHHLEGFATATRRRVDFDTVDLKCYDGFNAYLTNDEGLALNSVGKYIQTLKTFLRAAAEEGIEVNPAFRSRKFRAPSELTDKVYLNEQELTDLFRLDLSGQPRLERARDLFIVGAWTGLRFGDLTTIRPEQITGDRIRIRTAKTGTAVVIPLHPCVRAILTKYGNALPRAISNQKMNAYLREVTALVPSLQERVSVSSTVAGVRRYVTKAKAELVTTHTARRSFATNMYLAGVPVRTIMAITGHKTEQAFRLYIRLDADEHADILQAYMDKARPLAVVA
ncbi:MAG: Tyrosine recombinase XerC [Flavobacteriales bacterium]|nr:Tyrosine recombinase XerC [Flavobacteriales bacterium]